MAAMFRKFLNQTFGRHHHPKETEARLRLQKELFQFNKCSNHGFPYKPTALAYDSKLKLLAIGTRSGAVRIYGTPGVEFTAQHGNDISVTELYFLPEQARLVTLCSDNTLHLWEVNTADGKSSLEEVNVFNQFASEGSKLKTISTSCLTANGDQLLMGTEGGNIHILDIKTFDLQEHIIYQDVVMQNVPDDFKVNPGAVETIAQHPSDNNKFLIGYNRGLIVLWDNQDSNSDQTYNATQQLESVSWHMDGKQFMSSHADGSYIIWSTDDSTKPKEQATTPYGPFPCKVINKIQWKTAKADPVIIFSGGMPRASYGDRHTVSVMQGNDHVVFDFTSKVIDYLVLTEADEQTDDHEPADYDTPHTLVVLAEEELVLIDLETSKWPTFRQPYLSSLHSSAITTAQHVTNIPDSLWEKLVDAGKSQNNGFSARDWPIGGGNNLAEASATKDLLITGHEDGTLRFWDASATGMPLLYKLSTSTIFVGEFGGADQSVNDGDEEWPPFRKVGTFDPYSDDPKLGIQKISLCPLSETLVVAGTAGQVIVTQMERDDRDVEVKCVAVNVVSDRDNFVWKGHEAIPVKDGEVKFEAGFQPSVVMQLYPPAACTALTVHSEWQILSAGTGHGLALFDYLQKREVLTKCTLNPNDLTGTGESAMSRHKSFKKSLRESFRRIRRRRSHGGHDNKKAKKEEQKPAESPKKETPSGETKAPAAEASAETPATAEGETITPTEETPKKEETTPTPTTPTPTQEAGTRTIERQVEARPVDDSMASMVRTLYFSDTFLLNPTTHTPTLWAGTNAGMIYVYAITVPANDKRESEEVSCQLAKEIHLKHHAPVLSISVIDKNACPLPEPLEVQHERAKAPEMSGNHQLVICSEEQFKIFALPSLKAVGKEKVTANEGSKIRKIGFCSFRSKSDETYNETDIACLNNQGELAIYTIPGLRRQLKSECMKKEDITGIGSCLFTKSGQGFYLISSSEYQRFSLSPSAVTESVCHIELKEGMRPPPPEPEPEPEAVPVPEPEQPAQPEAETEAAAPPSEETPLQAEETQTPAQEKTDKPDDETEEGKEDTNEVSKTVITETTTTVTDSEEGNATMEKTTTVVTTTETHETSQISEISVADITVDSVTDYTEKGAEVAAPVTEGGGENIDDDTKAAQSEQTSEVTETTEQLEELKITEEGDTENQEPVSPTTSEPISSGKKKNKKRKSKK